ncbi:hypothetical protein [Halobacillus ihumii]|uniref:hypothetical protein n=1 Tax=Halobacillus ihumii TaxID=2686092 RepID=UPI0013D14D9F|nr:hypothetical protein [Halobacillus ihumii]
MKNIKLKVIGSIVLSIVTLFFLGLYVVDFLNDSEGQTADILIWVVIILTFFNSATWGSDSKTQKDEMGQQIKNKSGKISYYILTVFVFVLWFVYSQINESDLGSIFLLSAFCIGVITFPIVQFLVARRFMKD